MQDGRSSGQTAGRSEINNHPPSPPTPPTPPPPPTHPKQLRCARGINTCHFPCKISSNQSSIMKIASHEPHGISNHRQCDCLFNILNIFRLASKRTAKLYITGPLWKKSNGDRWILRTKGQKSGKSFHVAPSCFMGYTKHAKAVRSHDIKNNCWTVAEQWTPENMSVERMKKHSQAHRLINTHSVQQLSKVGNGLTAGVPFINMDSTAF